MVPGKGTAPLPGEVQADPEQRVKSCPRPAAVAGLRRIPGSRSAARSASTGNPFRGKRISSTGSGCPKRQDARWLEQGVSAQRRSSSCQFWPEGTGSAVRRSESGLAPFGGGTQPRCGVGEQGGAGGLGGSGGVSKDGGDNSWRRRWSAQSRWASSQRGWRLAGSAQQIGPVRPGGPSSQPQRACFFRVKGSPNSC